MPTDTMSLLAYAGIVLGVCLIFAKRFFRTRRQRPAVDAHGPSIGSLTDSLAQQIPTSRGQQESLQRDILRAGEYHPSAVANYKAFRNLFVILLVMAAGAIVVLVGPEDLVYGFSAGAFFLVLAFLAYAIPRVVLHARANQRVARIERGLADALDMITMCVGSGLSVRDALDQVTADIAAVHPDLGRELQIVHEQAKLGTLEQALEQFAARTDTDEVRTMVAMVSDTERLGSDIELAGRNHADHIRQQFRQRAEERSNLASVKVMLPFVLCVMPAFLLLLWGPSYIQLRTAVDDALGPNGMLVQDAQDVVRDIFNDANSPGIRP